jgi:hypothetical protein
MRAILFASTGAAEGDNDNQTLIQAVEAMNDEELFLAEKMIYEERRRRDVAAAGYATVSSAQVLIDLAHITNAVRESLRQDLSIASEPVLASVLEQIRAYSELAGDEKVVTELLRQALTAAVILEARCEADKRIRDCAGEREGNDNG